MATTYDRLKKIVVEQLGVDEEEVKPEASFVDDLNAVLQVNPEAMREAAASDRQRRRVGARDPTRRHHERSQ